MLKRAVLAMLILLVGSLIVQGVEELAELHVTTITLDPPSAITRGVDVEIHARVMNTGQRNADPVNVGLFYRPMHGSNSWILAESINGARLAPSQEDHLAVTFTLNTQNLELGTYEIRIVADPLNQISEIDELNNELRTSFILIASSIGLPDLQPISLLYTRTNPESADDMLPWNVTTTVQNPTSQQAGAFTVAFLLDGVEFDRQFLFALPANSTVDVVGGFDPFILELTPGTYAISVVIDPDEQVLEQDEENNSIAGALTLLSPDLHPISLAFDKSVLRLDEEMRVTAKIANGGEGTAKNVDVGFYVDHVRFALIQIPVLGRGLTTSIEAILSPDAVGLTDAPQTYEIEIIVDPTNALPELDEANNRMARSMTILEPGIRQPELHPESIELGPASPIELGRTDTVTLSTVVRNSGRAPAEDFDVSFYYRVKGGLRWERIPCSGESSCSGLDLASGMQSKYVSILPVILLQPGIYEIRVWVDSSSVVPELDESNNALVTSLTLLAARLPDLAFSFTQGIRVEPSTQVQRGQTVRFTPTITNNGDLDASGFFVRFSYQNMADATNAAQIGQQAEFRTSFFSPGSSIQVRSLAIGETAEIPVLLETRDLAPGQYLVQMEIDPAVGSSTGGQIAERNESNNILSSQIAVLGPDLAVLDLYTLPGNVVDQSLVDSIDIVSTIINSGVAPAGEFTVKFQLLSMDDTGFVPLRVHTCGESVDCGSPEFFGEVTLPGIGPLVPEQVRCSLDLANIDLEPGQYIVRVLVDCEGGIGTDGLCVGQVNEHNELNNLLEMPIVIAGRRAIDLSVGDVAKTSAENKFPVEFTATIANLGVKSAGEFRAVLHLFGTLSDCADSNPRVCEVPIFEQVIEVPGLGGLASFDAVWTVDMPAIDALADLTDIYVARVHVDCDGFSTDSCQGDVDESDETNNTMDIPVVISGWRAVDLSVSDLVTTSYDDSSMVTFKITVANTGVKSADGFGTVLRLFGTLADCSLSNCEVPVFEQTIQVPGLSGLSSYDIVWTVDGASIDRLAELTDIYVARINADCDGIVDGSCQGHIKESNELNNSLETPVVVPGWRAVDLSVVNLEMAPEDDTDLVTFTATIENTGVKSANGFNIALRLLGTLIDCVDSRLRTCEVSVFEQVTQVPGLDGLATYDVVWTVDLGSLDGLANLTGALVAQVDLDCDGIVGGICQGHIAESNEENNSIRSELQLGTDVVPSEVGEGADLSIQSFHALELSGTPSTTQIWATILNRGTEDVGEFYVIFYYVNAGGVHVNIDKVRVRSLAAGTDTAVVRQFDTSTFGSGYHIAGILVDIDQDIPETNERNNSRETDLLIR